MPVSVLKSFFFPVTINDQFLPLLNCLLVATDPTSCRFILHSHRALRWLISPTEHEHCAVCVLIHTTWLLYRLLQYKACCYSNLGPRMKPIKILFISLALCFSTSLTKSPHLCICKCFHMKSTSGVVQLFVHLVLGVGTNQVYIAFIRQTAA